MSELKERFRSHVAVSAFSLATDLTALLNRAAALGIAICPEVDSEGSSYSIEWAFDKESVYLEVDWDPTAKRWAIEPKEENKK